MLEDGLVTLLNSDGAVAGLLSGRIYPVQGVPDNPTYPYITYQDVSGSSEYTFDSTEERMQRIQFDVWTNVLQGSTYGNGKSVLKALRNVLSGYVGTLQEGTRVLFAARLNEMDDFDQDSRSYKSVAEYEFHVSETP